MAENAGARAAELLIDQAWADHRAGRYQATIAAAAKAAEAARALDDLVLLVRALNAEGQALRMLGDSAAALARFTQILGLAQDPANRDRLDDSHAAAAVADAHWNWTECARFVSGIPVRELLQVLDAGERWLAAAGHRDWRAAVLCQRALTHQRLGNMGAAVAAAEEALAVALRHPSAAGYTLAAHRFTLGDILRDAGRATDALPHYRAILADPSAGPRDRSAAHEGLAECALAAGDAETARREAHSAVLLAEPLGDNALCTALDVFARACLAGKDVDSAWQAASRRLDAARRVGGHYRPYHAVRTAFDVAMDREDFATARRLLDELAEHAAALDASDGTTSSADSVAQRRRRLADAERSPG